MWCSCLYSPPGHSQRQWSIRPSGVEHQPLLCSCWSLWIPLTTNWMSVQWRCSGSAANDEFDSCQMEYIAQLRLNEHSSCVCTRERGMLYAIYTVNSRNWGNELALLAPAPPHHLLSAEQSLWVKIIVTVHMQTGSWALKLPRGSTAFVPFPFKAVAWWMLCDISYDTKTPRQTLQLNCQPQCNYECHNLRYSSENEFGGFSRGTAVVNITKIIPLLLLSYNTLAACGNLARLTWGDRLRRLQEDFAKQLNERYWLG